MKARTLMLFCVLCLSVSIILGSCATMKSPDKLTYERFCGTWANLKYEPEPGVAKKPVKIIINPDGTMIAYFQIIQTGPTLIATYTVHKRWNDSVGDSYYHVEVYLPNEYATRYELWRVDKYNMVWEVQYSNIDYPEVIDPKDFHSYHHNYYRY